MGADRRQKRQIRADSALADKQNQANIDLWNQQKEYDYEMWQKNNEYNSPSAQVQRLQDAGINPALAMSNVSTGTSQSSAGGQTPPTMERANVPDFNSGVNAEVQNLALIGKQFSDISKQMEETRSIQLNNAWQNTERSVRLANELKDGRLREEAIYNAKRSNQLFDRTYEAQVMQQEEQSKLTFQLRLNAAADGSLKELQKDAQQYTNDNLLPQQWSVMQNQMRVAIIHAVTEQYNAVTNRKAVNSQIEVNNKTIEEIDSRIQNNIEDKKTKEFWNSVNDSTRREIILKIVSEATNSALQPFWQSISTVGNVVTGLK